VVGSPALAGRASRGRRTWSNAAGPARRPPRSGSKPDEAARLWPDQILWLVSGEAALVVAEADETSSARALELAETRARGEACKADDCICRGGASASAPGLAEPPRLFIRGDRNVAFAIVRAGAGGMTDAIGRSPPAARCPPPTRRVGFPGRPQLVCQSVFEALVPRLTGN
jgi:hypothetical protein